MSVSKQALSVEFCFQLYVQCDRGEKLLWSILLRARSCAKRHASFPAPQKLLRNHRRRHPPFAWRWPYYAIYESTGSHTLKAIIWANASYLGFVGIIPTAELQQPPADAGSPFFHTSARQQRRQVHFHLLLCITQLRISPMHRRITGCRLTKHRTQNNKIRGMCDRTWCFIGIVVLMVGVIYRTLTK